MTKEKQLLAYGVAAAALVYLWRRNGSGGVLPSFPLTLSNGGALPQIGLAGTLPSSPLILSNGQPLPYFGLVPFRSISRGGDATVPNVAADAARATNTPTYAGWSGPGGTPNPNPTTWGVPDVGGYPQVGLVPAPATNGDLLDQARADDTGDLVLAPAGIVSYDDSPSITSDTQRAANLAEAGSYALDLAPLILE